MFNVVVSLRKENKKNHSNNSNKNKTEKAKQNYTHALVVIPLESIHETNGKKIERGEKKTAITDDVMMF